MSKAFTDVRSVRELIAELSEKLCARCFDIDTDKDWLRAGKAVVTAT